jgi:hypothetical protein
VVHHSHKISERFWAPKSQIPLIGSISEVQRIGDRVDAGLTTNTLGSVNYVGGKLMVIIAEYVRLRFFRSMKFCICTSKVLPPKQWMRL